MDKLQFEVVKYNDQYREQVLAVWEKSVLATHEFLKPDDYLSIKEFLAKLNFNDFEVYCLVKNSTVAGFLGVATQKVEMLFLSPDFIGLGLGKRLLNFAVSELKAHKLDVNEQNTNAVAFYKKFGFETYERTDKDDQGKEYPLLRMKLYHFANTRNLSSISY